MSTTEDFKKAPIGAMATHEDGARALKVDGPERRWILQNGLYLDDKEIEQWGYTLDPLPDPEPDWLDAPAVMARPEDDTWVAVWQPCEAPWCSGATRNESRWVSPRGGAGCRSWRELTDVTPLYPKGQDGLNPSNSMGLDARGATNE